MNLIAAPLPAVLKGGPPWGGRPGSPETAPCAPGHPPRYPAAGLGLKSAGQVLGICWDSVVFWLVKLRWRLRLRRAKVRFGDPQFCGRPYRKASEFRYRNSDFGAKFWWTENACLTFAKGYSELENYLESCSSLYAVHFTTRISLSPRF